VLRGPAPKGSLGRISVDSTTTTNVSRPFRRSLTAGDCKLPPTSGRWIREVGVRELFARVMREAGLSAVLGSGLVARSLRDVGASVETASDADYARALPRLEARLKTYLDPEEVARISATLRAGLARGVAR
jgi:hypothetical protein